MRHCIVLAVNIPPHAPAPPQHMSSRYEASSSLISPDLTRLGTMKSSWTVMVLSLNLPQAGHPGSMGPPRQNMVGMSRRAAAIIMPGSILSHVVRQTMASKPWAPTITSTESAISSLLGRLILIPSWPMAMPSQTPMVLNSNGVPPASTIPLFTCAESLSRCMWPGTISFQELATAMRGFLRSASVSPTPLKRERWTLRSIPSTTFELLRLKFLVEKLDLCSSPRNETEFIGVRNGTKLLKLVSTQSQGADNNMNAYSVDNSSYVEISINSTRHIWDSRPSSTFWSHIYRTKIIFWVYEPP